MEYTERKRIEIRHDCPPFGVFLRWVNPLNNYEGWMFTGRTTRVLAVGDAVTFASEDERTDEVLKKDAAPVVTLRTINFSKEQAVGLASLFTSPKVLAYINGKEIPVRIGGGTFTTVDEVVKRQSLTFDIFLPKVNSLTQ